MPNPSQAALRQVRRLGRKADTAVRGRLRAGGAAEQPSDAETAALAGAVAYVRDRLAAKAPSDAIVLANGISQLGGRAEASDLLHGLIAFKRGDLEAAWDHLSATDPHLWATHAPVEATRSGLRIAPDRVLSALRGLAEKPAAALPVESWYHLTGAALGAGDRDLARSLFRRFNRAGKDRPGEWPKAEMQREWLRPWIKGHGPHPAPQLTDGHVRVGILAFGSPERKSSSYNLGDPVQTLGSIGHLVRHQVRFHGDPELVDALEHFQRQVPEELRRDTTADVDVMIVDRDATRFNDIPPDTWMLVIGWWMYPIFGGGFQMPLNENIKPIILSFYCRHPSFLTPEVVDYLRRYGPIGCRDWTTVDLLLKADVPAFFSGCVTSTVSTVFDRNRVIDRDETIYVEAPDTPEGAPAASQIDDGMRDQTPAMQLRRVHEMLDGYRHFRKIHTKRLHCYMPSRSLGVDVKFLPGNPADPRYPGLVGISDAQFDAIRDGINDLIEPIMTAILRRDSEGDIRRLWRELTADKVAAARERLAAPIAELPPVEDDADQVARARAAIRTVTGTEQPPADALTVVTPVRSRAQLGAFQVLLRSVMTRTDRPVDWLVVTANIPAASLAATSPLGLLAARFDQLRLRTVAATNVPEASLTLSLPELLDADRIIQMDPETLVLGDLDELAAVALDGRLAAAPSASTEVFGSGMEELRAAAAALRDRDRAAEFRRQALIRQPRDLRTFRTDVLVLDAHRLRSARIGELARRYAQEFKINNRQQLLLLVGADQLALPAQWSQVAGSRPLPSETRLVHFADGPKPWEAGVGYQADRWRAERDAIEASQG